MSQMHDHQAISDDGDWRDCAGYSGRQQPVTSFGDNAISVWLDIWRGGNQLFCGSLYFVADRQIRLTIYAY